MVPGTKQANSLTGSVGWVQTCNEKLRMEMT